MLEPQQMHQRRTHYPHLHVHIFIIGWLQSDNALLPGQNNPHAVMGLGAVPPFIHCLMQASFAP